MPEPLGRNADFLLRVKGESMIDAGILDGDIVVVQRAQDARNGEIVVALVGDDESADEATVKTFYREAGRVRLQPENDALEPIYADHVQILGTRRRGLPEPLMTRRAPSTAPSTRSWPRSPAAPASSASSAASSCSSGRSRTRASSAGRCSATASKSRNPS